MSVEPTAEELAAIREVLYWWGDPDGGCPTAGDRDLVKGFLRRVVEAEERARPITAASLTALGYRLDPELGWIGTRPTRGGPSTHVFRLVEQAAGAWGVWDADGEEIREATVRTVGELAVAEEAMLAR